MTPRSRHYFRKKNIDRIRLRAFGSIAFGTFMGALNTQRIIEAPLPKYPLGGVHVGIVGEHGKEMFQVNTPPPIINADTLRYQKRAAIAENVMNTANGIIGILKDMDNLISKVR